MPFQKKNRFKPVFKQFLRLRENVQNRQKLLRFKKKKWKQFLKFYIRKLKFFKKFKSLDHSKYFVTKHGTRGASYKKRFRNTLHAGKRLRIFYGNLMKKHLKKRIKLALNKKTFDITQVEKVFLGIFENRLDTVLYRAKFVPTIRSAQQLILHGKVYVNRVKIKTKAYNLKYGDTINLNQNSIKLYENSIVNSVKWPTPPKHLVINYNTLHILFLGDIGSSNFANEFSFNLRLSKILVNYHRH